MTATVLRLNDFRIDPPASNFVSVQPIVGGAIALILQIPNSNAHEFVLTVGEMKEHIQRCEDAVELAGGVLR